MEEIGRNPTDVSQLRVGIVGTGFIGSVHARAARLAGARIVGVAGSTPERAARAYAARLAERVFRSAEDLIESGELDVLHVCTPNHLHASITIKPLATDFDAAALMAARAAQSARTATAPFVYRFHPMARTVGGAVGTMAVSQVSPGRKNRLFLEISGSEASVAFDQEQPETLWLGRRQGSELLVRDPQTLSLPVLRYSSLPAGHAQGYHDCFDAFTADSYAAVRGERPEGLPTFDDGARAARICDSVLASARTRSWVEVHPA
ncbi:Gfo/Idh/MocA family protein [Streptosporangium sp. NBC_01756]|uniref:Gfo/Idh/MocA family protein n=1 Tax=Streptosporangium sp. NBC_01756 TaxID=2975950 RepID=UPI002DDB140A|nr:Gfo/Idh/MocA family oxidoreductase [Streptosporangium sp. NBC_01756]WSC86755.1 Gfo/Idh/MocA family oxidoreductase [Streptosporangium sp. NBC_01756]